MPRFLTPVPLRGQKNMPDYVIHTYKFLADLRNENLTVLQQNILNNFNTLRTIHTIYKSNE